MKPSKVTGIDISLNMLNIGKEKLIKKGLTDRIELFQADSENIPFADSVFDVAMVAFGVRNFSDPLKGTLGNEKGVTKWGFDYGP